MDISKSIIDEAFEFYGIKDRKYKELCFECIDSINNELLKKVEEVYNILYFGNDSEVMELWKIQDKNIIFGKDVHSFITNVIVLLGYKEHIANINKCNLEKEQVLIHKKRIRECLESNELMNIHEGIRNSQMIWASHFIRCNIIEVGILQFEYKTENPINGNKEKCIKIHIPTGNKLNINEVKESIIKSKSLIKKYFKLDNSNYYCKSWMLSFEVRKVLNDKSNIYQFGNLFDITIGQECNNQILNFVFNDLECVDLSKLVETTSLQRSLKQLLIRGQNIYIGIGKLKKEYEWTN